MNKRQAYKVLCVAPSADGRLVEQAYWHLAHRYRDELNHDGEAKERLKELNEAYSVLTDHGEAEPVELVKASPPPRPEPVLAEVVAVWARRLAESTAARWAGHGVEIAVLTACLVVLAALAVLDGASLIWTLLVLAVALVTIWSPWRRVG
jgi:hypothetical protein